VSTGRERIFGSAMGLKGRSYLHCPFQVAEATNRTADDDPAKLWDQMGKDNTDAEIALAKLCMEGEVIAQNCD
jgi:hypothetical protein